MYDIFILDVGGFDNNLKELQARFPQAITTRFYGGYLDTIRRCCIRAQTKFIWVIGSQCDYSNFNFSYEPPPWEAYQVHCWASGSQMYGDTFLVPVQQFLDHPTDKLEWYLDVNYHEAGVPRLVWPAHYYGHGDQTSAIKNTVFNSEYQFFSRGYVNFAALHYQPALWGPNADQIVSYSTDNSVNLVPRCAKGYLKRQLYGYPKFKAMRTIQSEPLDIVYISNGEPDADKWYEHTVKMSKREVKRVTGVNGRGAAYFQAARVSDTDWFLAVFAKLEVSPTFRWDWQPDYAQEPKHYIFTARNPLNGLEYGHQAMIAYNKNLVLDTIAHGLDFTLSKPHCVVPMHSGIAHFNQSPWMTWRTAFREVIKLMHSETTVETQHRLEVWLSKANGDYAEWCLAGAQDAVKYYHSVSGRFDDLMKTFEWDWLQEYFTRQNTLQSRSL